MKQKKLLHIIALIVFTSLLLCLYSCTKRDGEISSSSQAPATTSIPTLAHTPTTASTSAPTETPTETPTAAPTETASTASAIAPTETPTQKATPTVTVTATPVPIDPIQLPIDFAEATGSKSKYTSRAPMKQVSYTVTDPYNTRGLSTTRIGHWFGSNTSQPLKFQSQYEAKGWNAITIDTKTTEKVIYLTFDCGYENGYTEKILNTLKEKNCPAAFFCTLEYVEHSPGLTARMIEDGHIVGNHSSNHPDFSKISRERMAREVQKFDNYLRVYFGYSSPYFRYPSGAYSENSMELLTSLGYRTIFWSYAYDDYTEGRFPGKEAAFNYVTKRLHPGEILLLHAISPGNADALGDIIDYARAQGYEFRSLDQYFGG